MTYRTPRANDLAAIHATAKQLGMEDDTYRDMLWTVARVRSAADLDFAGRKRVLEHLRAIGGQFKRPGKGNEWSWIDAAPGNNKPRLRLIIVLCKRLGIERGKQVRYVEGIAENMDAVIRSAKADGARADKLVNVKKALQLCSWGELGMIINALEKAVERKERKAA